MKWILAPILLFSHWYYIPLESPSKPVEINSIHLNLKKDEMAFTFFSLSDGESALIQHPDGKNVLLNSGGQDTKEELEKLLALYHVDRIDTIILTDTKKCCLQNANWLVNQFKVKQLMSGLGTDEMIQALGEREDSLDILPLSKGMNQEILPGLMMSVLNDTKGLDISLNFLNRRVLWLNHTSLEAEKYLPLNDPIETTIVKLPNYAAKEFISMDILDKLDPELAILVRNKGEEINDDLLEQLHHAWVRVYYNKNQGAVSVKFTKDNYEIIKISNQKK